MLTELVFSVAGSAAHALTALRDEPARAEAKGCGQGERRRAALRSLLAGLEQLGQARAMTENVLLTCVMGLAAACGAIVGRVFASEAPDRPTAVFAAAYCGAGAGLVAGPPLALVLTLIVELWRSPFGLSILIDALEAAGAALFWGIAGGLVGGLTLGILVAALKK
jgi:hypothetical protein